MPNIDRMFPSRYLKVGDLDGREIILTMKEVKMENVGQAKESKPVLYFRGAGKGMVLNVTNSKRIATFVGSPDTDDWPGHKVCLYPTETEFAGETVECIRVKDPNKRKAAPEPESEPPVKKAGRKKVVKTTEPEPDDELPAAVVAAPEPPEEDFDPDDKEIPF